MMASESESRCQLTNDFSMTFGLAVESDTYPEQFSPKLGRPSSLAPVKHRLTVRVAFLCLFAYM